MSGTPYFPPLYGDVDCGRCEIASKCPCQYRYQRNRRDFLPASGRCPRLPDWRGFVDMSQRELYAKTFPLIHAERGEEMLNLNLTLPGSKRLRKVYQTRGGSWYFREKSEFGDYIRRAINFECCRKKDEILNRMELYDYDYCLFRATIEDYFV